MDWVDGHRRIKILKMEEDTQGQTKICVHFQEKLPNLETSLEPS